MSWCQSLTASLVSADGSQVTAADTHWMKAQLQKIEESCERGDQADAEHRLSAIQDLIEAHAGQPEG